jgi:hypothetical protein
VAQVQASAARPPTTSLTAALRGLGPGVVRGVRLAVAVAFEAAVLEAVVQSGGVGWDLVGPQGRLMVYRVVVLGTERRSSETRDSSDMQRVQSASVTVLP